MQNRKRDTDEQNRLLDSVGEGKGGMFWENSIETCILSRVKQVTSPGWMHETGARAWCTGKTMMGWGGRREGGSGWGIHVNPWLIHFNVWQNPLQYCKVIRLQLIKNKIKFKKRCRKIKLTWNSTLRYPSMTHQWSHKYISFMRSYHTCYFYCYLFKERRFSSFSNSVHCYPVFCPGHPC